MQLAMGLTCDSPLCKVSEGRVAGIGAWCWVLGAWCWVVGAGWWVLGGGCLVWVVGAWSGWWVLGSTGSEPSVRVADRPGLLMVIVDVLTGMFVSVTSAEIDTEGVVAKDVFTVSYHGGPLDVEMITVR
ncbi:unnamed protein product [Closterium sp. Naga37s-1]|nr:unnamed protein product [Closterium sp. Naga37s-1]